MTSRVSCLIKHQIRIQERSLVLTKLFLYLNIFLSNSGSQERLQQTLIVSPATTDSLSFQVAITQFMQLFLTRKALLFSFNHLWIPTLLYPLHYQVHHLLTLLHNYGRCSIRIIMNEGITLSGNNPLNMISFSTESIQYLTTMESDFHITEQIEEFGSMTRGG